MTLRVGHEPAVNNCIGLLKSRFSEIQDAKKVSDSQHYLQCYVFDTIGEITFGKRFGFLDLTEVNQEVMKALNRRLSYSAHLGVTPWLHGWIFPWLPKSGGHGYIGNWTLQQITSKKQEVKDPNLSDKEGASGFHGQTPSSTRRRP
jgi:hypothetical protein